MVFFVPLNHAAQYTEKAFDKQRYKKSDCKYILLETNSICRNIEFQRIINKSKNYKIYFETSDLKNNFVLLT